MPFQVTSPTTGLVARQRQPARCDFHIGVDYDISLPQAYLEVYARDHGVPFIDFLPILRAHVLRTNERLVLKSDIHLNNRGHEIVGKNLAEWFRCCVRDRARLRETTDEPQSGS